ncbi:MAG: AAA family ATPase [Bacteroidales bacterium]|nr:AAA family ATPase [Bacteroidales bacterium]
MKQTEQVKYPIGVQSFREIREGGYAYVDKTGYIFRLINDNKYYFLSRPRRFGKSLLLSTIEAYYLGMRDLFKGLALDSLTDDWEPHPVFHLDLNNREYKDDRSLIDELNANLEEWETRYGYSRRDRAPEERFAYLIRQAYEQTGKKVVILVDEYDKPLLNTIDNPKLADIYRSQLKAFYSNLKTMDPYIELGLLTGVARFSKVSIFSDLNNLRDISFSNEFAAVCGITSEEVDRYFGAGIERLAREMELTIEETREELRRRYDGYHFAAKSPDIYNPFSLVNVFASDYMGDYWFDSGTPTYLVKLLRRQGRSFKNISPVMVERRFLESAGLLSPDPVPVLYQAGYLTIKEYHKDLQTYLLEYPNEEVKRGFLDFLLHAYIPEMTSGSGFTIPDFVMDVREGRPEEFMKRMESLIADVPYGDKGTSEDHFQNAVYLLFTLLGYFAKMEDRTSNGRIDLQVETPEYVYIFEFKIDSTARKAMDQIREKRYWLRNAASGRQIFLIGANFSTRSRSLDDVLIERP